MKNTVSEGIISSIRTDMRNKDLQITAPISPGSSGGVLLNGRGNVIGITYSSLVEGENLNFALPINVLENVSWDTFLSLERFNTGIKLVDDSNNIELEQKLSEKSMMLDNQPPLGTYGKIEFIDALEVRPIAKDAPDYLLLIKFRDRKSAEEAFEYSRADYESFKYHIMDEERYVDSSVYNERYIFWLQCYREDTEYYMSLVEMLAQ